jgi:hypothetical protein
MTGAVFQAEMQAGQGFRRLFAGAKNFLTLVQMVVFHDTWLENGQGLGCF